jgi:hypothetical protein
MNRGVQIGRIFAIWASVFFGQLFEKYKSRPNFWATFSMVKVFYINFYKNGLGHI